VNPVAFVLGGGCLLLILALRRWAPRVPGVLLAVVGATLVVGVFDLTARAGVSVVGPMPQGLPALQWPSVSLDELGPLLAAAVAIAMMSFAETSVLARTFALRAGEETDDNQELIALGAANVAAGLFQGFAVSSSASPGLSPLSFSPPWADSLSVARLASPLRRATLATGAACPDTPTAPARCATSALSPCAAPGSTPRVGGPTDSAAPRTPPSSRLARRVLLPSSALHSSCAARPDARPPD
jgi:hypothetical protein